MTSTQNTLPLRGDKVAGTYYGVPFAGTVTEARGHSINDSRLTHVTLDSEITVYGRARASIVVVTDYTGNDWAADPCGNSIRKAN